jgi:hypothetical protein
MDAAALSIFSSSGAVSIVNLNYVPVVFIFFGQHYDRFVWSVTEKQSGCKPNRSQDASRSEIQLKAVSSERVLQLVIDTSNSTDHV